VQPPQSHSHFCFQDIANAIDNAYADLAPSVDLFENLSVSWFHSAGCFLLSSTERFIRVCGSRRCGSSPSCPELFKFLSQLKNEFFHGSTTYFHRLPMAQPPLRSFFLVSNDRYILTLTYFYTMHSSKDTGQPIKKNYYNSLFLRDNKFI